MNFRPVNSEQAYDEAIERIESLRGAESGTPEGDELDVLLTLVRVYEKENHPVPPLLLLKQLALLWSKGV
jgi:HTH-type transcriptional regulator/antitoxin HigA